MVLIGVLIFETLALGWLSGQRTVLLIPQHLASANGEIAVNLAEPFSPDYITGVARGDISALLNWTPDSIEAQYGLFIGRLTPQLHSVEKENLLNEAKQHKEEGLTQSFYVTKTFVKGSTVELDGILVRAASGREVFRAPATYEISYTNAGNGMLLISGVTQPGTGAK